LLGERGGLRLWRVSIHERGILVHTWTVSCVPGLPVTVSSACKECAEGKREVDGPPADR
jgi:hypothetical protein